MAVDQTYLVVLEPCRASFVDDATDAESAIVTAHFAYLQGLLARGTLVLAGRADDGHPGLIILRAASLEHARRITADDPAIGSGIFDATVKPFRLALIESRNLPTPGVTPAGPTPHNDGAHHDHDLC